MIKATIHLLTTGVCLIAAYSPNLSEPIQIALVLAAMVNFVCCIIEAEFSR